MLTATTAVTYDNIGNVMTVDGPLPGAADTSRLHYNADRELIGVVGPDPDGAGPLTPSAIQYNYNVAGLVFTTSFGTVTDQSDAAWANYAEAYHNYSQYDGSGRTIRTTVWSNGVDYNVHDYLYDALGRPSCTIVYMDPSRWGPQASSCIPLQTNGPNGPDRVTQTNYDAASHQTSSVSGIGTASQRTEVTSTYTPNGKVASVKDGNNNLTAYTYDGVDRPSQVNYPSKTTVNQASTTDYEVFGYDAASNRTSRRLRDGRTITFAFDNLNRLITKGVPTGCAPIQVGACAPASATRSVYYGYDLRGAATYARFDSVSGDGVTAAYDALGRLTTATTAMNGTSRALAYQYDLAGDRTQILHPDGVHFDTTFDPLNRMKNATWYTAATGTVPYLAITFDSLGRRTIINRASSYTDYGFDAVSRLTSQVQQFAGSTGNMTENLGYNPGNQIASRSRSTDDFIATSAVAVNRPYAANGLNQYTTAGSATFTYDANGNIVSDGTNTYVYDAENRLVSSSANSMTLTYDPLGRLWQTASTVLGKTQFLTDGNHDVLEYDGDTGAIRRRFMWGPGADEPILEDEGGAMNCSGTRFLHTDHTSSIIAVADCNGNRINVNGYDEFGIPNSNNFGRFQYTGQAWLADLGMYYYKARMYSPTLGRFMQTDPIGYGDGLNWHNYAHSDPVNGRDTSGLETDVPSVAVSTEGGADGGGAGGGDGEIVVTGPAPSTPTPPPSDDIVVTGPAPAPAAPPTAIPTTLSSPVPVSNPPPAGSGGSSPSNAKSKKKKYKDLPPGSILDPGGHQQVCAAVDLLLGDGIGVPAFGLGLAAQFSEKALIASAGKFLLIPTAVGYSVKYLNVLTGDSCD